MINDDNSSFLQSVTRGNRFVAACLDYITVRLHTRYKLLGIVLALVYSRALFRELLDVQHALPAVEGVLGLWIDLFSQQWK